MTRNIQNVLKTLRNTQLLQRFSNLVTQQNFAPTTVTIVMGICASCNCAVIAAKITEDNFTRVLTGKVLGTIVSFVCTVFIIVVCNVVGKAQISMGSTIQSWKIKETDAYCRKVLNSVRPEGVKIADFTSFGRMTTVNVVFAILRYTGRYMISLKRKN